MKEGDFVLIESIVYNEGQKDENYSTHTGIVSYVSEANIGFKQAVTHTIFKNGKTYVTKSDTFSVNKKWLKL